MDKFLTGGFEIYENKLYVSGTLDLSLPALTKINLIFESQFQNCCYDFNGDINCDEIWNISDIILMIDIILDLIDYGDQNYCADMNNDGITDISDLLLIDTILVIITNETKLIISNVIHVFDKLTNMFVN